MERILTEEERWVVLNALQVAQDLHKGDSEAHSDPSLQRQCRMQAEDAKAMYDLIEQADAISLAPPADDNE